MSYFTTDLYELKREIVNFSTKMAYGLSKPKQKFVMDVQFGLATHQSVTLSDIARALHEDTKHLNYTIERLSNHFMNFTENDMNQMMDNYYRLISNTFDEEPLVILDDSDIAKKYGSKFEDLCTIKDASAKEVTYVSGYHVAEAVTLTKRYKQPISLYSHIYSSKSEGFISKNEETFKSIDKVKEVLKRKCTFVCDRGYDGNAYFDKFFNSGDDFIIRLKKNRNLLFKDKSKNVGEVAKNRKGKVKMKLFFSGENKEVYVSYTKVNLPRYKDKGLTLVMVYGIDEEEAMLLLTSKLVKNKKDVHQIVSSYISRWRIEDYFRFKKQTYDFENIRLRTLKGMNCMNAMLSIQIGYIARMSEKMRWKLLTIKIIERSQSIRKAREYKRIWLYQLAKGIKNILSYAQKGIRHFQDIEQRKRQEQLQLFDTKMMI